MKLKRSRFTHASWVTVLSLAIIWAVPCADFLSAQSRSTIDAGTTIQVRTNEEINARDDDGRIYTGYVEQDVTDRSGRIAIPRGSNVEMMVRRNSDNDVYLDLDSVNVNGRQFGVEAQSNVVENERKEGLGANQRTGKYVGGGAVLGAIIGAIAGGGKGAAIGAGAGAAAGAGTQVLTRGRSVRVPSESLLTFRLTEPLRAGVSNAGYYTNNGVRYRSRDAFYGSADARQKPSHYSNGRGTVAIGSDRNVSWNGPENGSVYVLVDNEAPKLFAAGASGTQAAPWIINGHVYTFVLRDAYGNEIARDTMDTRGGRNRFRR